MVDSLLKQAVDLLEVGQSEKAECLAEKAVEANPESARAWFLIGVARHQTRRLDAALPAIEHALAIDPGMDEARRASATLLLELKRPREALAQIEELLRRRPAEADFLVDAGVVLEELGEPEASLARYSEAVRRAPSNFRGRLNRGVLLARLGRLEEALQDNQSLVRSHVGSAIAFYNLADVLLRLDRYAEALSAVEQALRLQPESANMLMLRGLALAMLGRDTEASSCFTHAHKRDATSAERYHCVAARAAGLAGTRRPTLDPRQIRLARLLEHQKSCDWSQRDRLIAGMRDLAESLSLSPGGLEEIGLYHTALSLPLTASEQQALARGLAQGVTIRAGADNHSGALPARKKAGGDRKIRLGFISPNFREHPSAQQHWRHLALRDRTCFDVFAYSLRSDDGFLRQRIVDSCDTFIEVSDLDSQEIASRIAFDGIDILVDLAGHMDFSRPEVFALRPAPLRVSYFGLPATMGAELIDYRITDKITTQAEETSSWGEKLVFLPDTLWVYNDKETIAEAKPLRSDCGLPECCFVFCCFNASYKIEPDVFGVWMRLLARLPNSVLWLLDGGENVRRHLQREAAARGISPDRLVFAPHLTRAEHLARHDCADLFLDTFYCGAHTTAADSLWAGLPVLTCPGETMASRISTSIVRAAGLSELVADDRHAYESAAFRLATQPSELAALRKRLIRNRSTCALFDTARRVRELDQAFKMMWHRYASGLPPESFAVPSEARTRA